MQPSRVNRSIDKCLAYQRDYSPYAVSAALMGKSNWLGLILGYGGATVIFLYGVIPVIVKTNPWVLEEIVFMNRVRWPSDTHVTEPERYGIQGCRSFYLKVDDDSTIGVWHILPSSMTSAEIPTDQYERHLNNGKPIFIYFHGNAATRAQKHRVELMQKLAGMDYHVISIDYRGFADSTGSPSEDGILADAYETYKWVMDRSGTSPIFIWGHSLGSAVTSKLTKHLCSKGEEPAGIILEAPFSNLRDGVVTHPFALIYRILPWFEWLLTGALDDAGVYFTSDEHLKSVSVPMLILHAKDDLTIPYSHSEKLYEVASTNRLINPKFVKLVLFEREHRYGHSNTHLAPEMSDIVRDFVTSSITGES